MVLFKPSALLASLVVPLVAGQDQITPATFKAGIENGSYDLVLDVRRPDEWELGHIPTAVHVNNVDFEDNEFWETMDLEELYSCNSSCVTIVVYCRSGGRSGEAIGKLRAMGFEGTLLNGMGVSQWTNAGFELTLEEDSVEPICATSDICAPEVLEEEAPEEEEAAEETAEEPAEEEPKGEPADADATEETEDSVEADENFADSSAQGRLASFGLFFAVSTLFLVW